MRSYLQRFLPILVALAAVYWVALFVSTHVPADIEGPIDHFDKVIHASAYALLAFVLVGVLSVRRGYQRQFPVWVGTLCVAYAALDEYTQSFVPGRTADVMDLAADAAGAAAGLLAAHLVVLGVRRHRVVAPVTEAPVEV